MKKILVAEDNVQLGIFYKKFLNSYGYSVDVVSNASEALEKLHYDKDYVLFITDLDMPKWDGNYSLIGANVENKDIKIIIISGYLDNPKFAFTTSLSDNIVARLNKPFEPEELIEIIKKII
ncbi:response regulator [Candidatus Dependentiae bacterium]|nr:response regulator [Candidatus Dependentiae bacterium]